VPKQGTGCAGESSPSWETLEAWGRERIQGFIHALLEEEVTSVLFSQSRAVQRGAVQQGVGFAEGMAEGPRRRPGVFALPGRLLSIDGATSVLGMAALPPLFAVLPPPGTTNEGRGRPRPQARRRRLG
jgi:hypothetical protein